MIQLRNEGPLKPAPQLTGIVQEVSDEIQSWAGVVSATHWKLGDPTCVDGAEFHVADIGELGHIHLNGEVHILLTEKLRDRLLGHKLAKPFPWGKNWVMAEITAADEADGAKWLFKLGYDRRRSVPTETLLERIEERAGASLR